MRARSGADSHEQQIFKERKTKLLQPAQRFALPALGAADGVAVRPEKGWLRRKSRKMPQNPQRQMHALLGCFVGCRLAYFEQTETMFQMVMRNVDK